MKRRLHHLPLQKSRIIFSPGILLRDLISKTRYEQMAIIEKECDKPHAI